MALTIGTVLLKVLPDAGKFGSDLDKQAKPAMGRFEAAADKWGGRVQAVGAGLTAGVTLPLVGLGVAAVKAFGESQQVAAQTEAALKSTGKAAGVSKKQVGDLANSISKYSGIDDEAVQSAENLLLTFTNVRNETGKGNDIFNRATKSLADISARMGTDVSSSAIQMGKALNDPVRGISSLRRIGVSFSKGQEKVIAHFVKTGQTAKAQGVILDEVAKEFGGSAKAMGDTAAGRLARAKVQIGNAMEGIGAVIAPVISDIAGKISKLARWFQGLPKPAQRMVVGIGLVVAALGPFLLILGKLITTLPKLVSAFKFVVSGFQLLTKAFMANPWLLLIAAIVVLVIVVVKNWGTIKRVILSAWGAIQRFTSRVWGAILAFFKKWWPLLVIVFTGGLATLPVLLAKYWRQISDGVHRAWDAILGFFKGIPGKIKGFFSDAGTWLIQAGRDLIVGLGKGILSMPGVIWDAIKSVAGGLFGLVKKVFGLGSPSRVMAGYGRMVSQGFAVGISAGARDVFAASRTMADAVRHGGHAAHPAVLGRGVTLRGELTLTPDGRAFVEGVIAADHRGERVHARTVARMRRSTP